MKKELTHILTLKKLTEYIGYVQTMINQQQKLNPAMDVLTDGQWGYCNFGDKFISHVVDMLDEFTGADWVSWFVFENDFGKKKLEAGVADNMITVKNVNDLWKVIQMEV